jgi:hypothetical protein
VAVVILFRVAMYYAPRGTVYVGTAAGSGGATQAALSEIRRRLFNDVTESDASLSQAASEHSGTVVSVATYDEPFELRKVHLIFSANDAVVASDDSRVVTMHLAKISGGAVVDSWDGADFTAMMAAIDTWWGAIKGEYASGVTMDRVKAYKSGPAIEPPQVPVYDADRNISGTGTGGSLPPQCAISITEKAGSKRYWGRMYLPAPRLASVDTYGRLTSASATVYADATDTMFEALKTAALHPVVYRKPLPARTQKNGVALPARDGSAHDITDIQVDDIVDVIRSRRWKYPLLRTQRAIA